MVYLEYHKETRQVVEIHETSPIVTTEYDFTLSDNFTIGDEFELTIRVNQVDGDKNLTSYSAIRNNPNARRLLRENVELKEKKERLENEDLNNKEAIAELYLLSMGGF